MILLIRNTTLKRPKKITLEEYSFYSLGQHSNIDLTICYCSSQLSALRCESQLHQHNNHNASTHPLLIIRKPTSQARGHHSFSEPPHSFSQDPSGSGWSASIVLSMDGLHSSRTSCLFEFSAPPPREGPVMVAIQGKGAI